MAFLVCLAGGEVIAVGEGAGGSVEGDGESDGTAEVAGRNQAGKSATSHGHPWL
jgi:hypothetical protein